MQGGLEILVDMLDVKKLWRRPCGQHHDQDDLDDFRRPVADKSGRPRSYVLSFPFTTWQPPVYCF